MSTLILQADARQIPLADESVDCIVSSPPYWSLRDYQTGKWEGEDLECPHAPSETPGKRGIATSSLEGGKGTTGHQQEGYKASCPRCGARRIDKQIGLEEQMDCLGWATGSPCGTCYVCQMVSVFREVWRVLKPSGVVFLNLGDSYAGSWGNYHPNSPPGKHGQRPKETARWNRPAYESQAFLPPTANVKGLKPKDLCGVPWRVALALQADGWWLRQDIIWSKTAPMPESVQDRGCKSHEYIFLLAKNEHYYFDHIAIQEPGTNRNSGQTQHKYIEAYNNGAQQHRTAEGLIKIRNVAFTTRNRRSVWTINPEPQRHNHYASFPTEIPRLCISAGCPPRGITLDPFSGSGTTVLVADRLGRHGIGLDLSLPYCQLAQERLRNETPLFLAPEPRPAEQDELFP